LILTLDEEPVEVAHADSVNPQPHFVGAGGAIVDLRNLDRGRVAKLSYLDCFHAYSETWAESIPETARRAA
jgi:hypothetical protein